MTLPTQYVLPFEQAKNDLLAQIRFLRAVDLGLSPGRSEGVIQLLERLALLGNDLSERGGAVFVKAQIIAIAARVEARRTVSDRTVRNWRRDCEALGVLTTDHRSHKWGRCEWNLFRIDVTRIRQIVADGRPPIEAGNGRKWAETIAAPGAETIAAPKQRRSIEETNNKEQTPVVVVSSNEGLRPAEAEQRLVAAIEACGVGRVEEALKRAFARGLSVQDCETRVSDWKGLPESLRLPGTLYNWLATRGSYEADRKARQVETRPRAGSDQRGDGMSREEMQRMSLRCRIVRAGRAAGLPEEEIESRLQAAGV